MFLFSLTPASMADPTACLSGQGIKYFTATIYHEKIDEDLTDFPVLLHLSDNCGTNGFDASELFDELSSNDDRKKIAVCAGEDTQCYVEIESWDSSNREAWLWVKVPEISGSENTILRLYYGQELTENDEYIGEASDHLSFQMVLDKGAEGTYDTFNAESASVIKDGDAYKMWYSGHDGAKYRILHATSMDGITWTDHQMVLNVGSEGTYDTSRVFHPCVIKDGDTYKTWYTGYDGANYRILYATSMDGITWTDHQMVLNIGSEGTYDTSRVMEPCVIKDGDVYKMWYSGYDGANFRILYTTSMDGITWTDHQMVLNIGSEGTYDTSRVRFPCIVKEDGTYKMWYSGYDGQKDRILYTTSTDGITWTNHQVAIDIGAEGTYDTLSIYKPCVVKEGDAYKMWYSGRDVTNWRILYTESGKENWKTPSENVWDNHFAGVYHMGQDPSGGPGCIKDSTVHKRHGSPQGGMGSGSLVDGKVGRAIQFDGIDDGITEISAAKQISSVEVLAKTATGLGYILQQEFWNNSSNFFSLLPGIRSDNGKLQCWAYSRSGGNRNDFSIGDDSKDYRDGLWHNVAVSFDGGTGNAYLDGTLLGSDTYGFTSWNAATNYVGSIGKTREYNWNAGFYVYYSGRIDEVRISNVVRSPAWIKATYHSGTDDLMGYARPSDIMPPPAVESLTVNQEGDGASVTLDWSGYDESIHGDIASYRIYGESAQFTDVAGLTPRATVSAGTFTHTLGGLTRGQTYWFAVVVVDHVGNALTAVTPVSGVPTDILPPEDVSNLRIQCFSESLRFMWDHSADSSQDLAGYFVYFNGAQSGVSLSPTMDSFEQDALSPASAYDFRVTAFDQSGNESDGISITGITLLSNPTNLSAGPYDSLVNLSWDSVTPSELVKHYAVYVSESPFSTVEGMTPVLTTGSTSATVEGLSNGVTYHLAVTSVNLSDGEQKMVAPVSAMPYEDTAGPEISNVQVNGVLLVSGHTLKEPATFSLSAEDPGGVSRVEFFMDGSLLETDYEGSPHYQCYWNIVYEEDGAHTLLIKAFDGRGNNRSVSYSLVVALDPPSAPTITQPSSGTITNQAAVSVSGSADKYTEILFYVNGAETGDIVAVDAQGNFVTSLTLTEGENRIQAAARNRAGTGPQSEEVLVTLDTGPPVKPTITGGSVLSGPIQARPAENKSNSTTVTLTGTREDHTSVWINNVKRLDTGSGDWSVNLTLAQGDNILEIWLVDQAGNRGDSEWVDILIDSVAPAVTSMSPEDGSFLNAAPATLIIGFIEETSGLNLENSTHLVLDGSMAQAPGSWSISGGNQLIFTPGEGFTESVYTINLQLEDNVGNQSAPAQYHFTLDTSPPPAPVINPVTSPTHNPSQLVTGLKEAYAAILLGGQEVVGHTQETTWQHTVSLNSGQNSFVFAAKDRAGNLSDDAVVEILFDDIPPPAVETLTLNLEGDGTSVTLDWSGYDESLHGDVASYRIYAETTGFTDVTGLTPKGTVNAGTFTYEALSLTRGATYYFAVVAVDNMGNALATVSPVSGVPIDRVAPEDVTNLRVACFDNRLTFTWDHSLNTAGDLVGYLAYFNDAASGVTIASSQNSYEQTGLNPASAYPFRVTAFDQDGNESGGKSITGYTLLNNPANLSTTPQSGYVDLGWDPVTPSEYVKHYAVYVSESPFSTVEGMSPRLTTSATWAKVAGLTNNIEYFFALTSVNLSDGERKEVTTVPATPVQDAEGPEITNVRVNTVSLVDGHQLKEPVTFRLNASDPAGVSLVDFFIDGALQCKDYSGAPDYECFWNIVLAEEGSHTLTIVAYDTLGNSRALDFSVVVALDPPSAPAINQPSSGTVTNQPAVSVSGSADRYTEILFYINGAETGDVKAVDALGNFVTSLTLIEGENRIRAAARNRAGTGPMSGEVLVTLDTSIPVSPENLTAQSRAGGVIRLSWQAPSDTDVKGYHLYRAESSFSSQAQAVRVNSDLITVTSFDDLPAEDGLYYYRATMVSTSDNEGELSNEATAQSDSTGPRAVSIAYTPRGNHDPQTGRMGPGTVDVLLTVDEPLQSTPFLSITPEGGVPFSIELTKESDLTYTGLFVITDATPTGTAYGVFSGRDLVGNRGTEIDTGGSILIDTDGPSVIAVNIDPSDPIQNNEDDPVAVTVRIGLNDEMKPGEAPDLSYLLSGEGRDAIAVSPLTQVTQQEGEAQAWQGGFTLPGDAGLSEVESFHLIYSGRDDLENVSDKILSNNLFQVYQGDLPPLASPEGLQGVSLPGGRIQLTWNQVEGAAGYQLYRKAPGESELTAYQRLGAVLEYTDEPAQDGLYTYAVASIRQFNQQESLSGMSHAIEVASDATVPGPPRNLALELVSQGIIAQWTSPDPYTEPVTYRLYRADLTEITSVSGLTPLADGIEQTAAIDPSPSPSDHCYVVTAVDGSGNESIPSNSFYLNFDLLPVSSLRVVQRDIDPPVITWTHPGGDIAGYDIYLGPEGNRVKLNYGLLTSMTFTDTGYSGDERRYTVIAIDSNGLESMGRSVTLPLLSAQLSTINLQPATLKRGLMNRVAYQVENHSSTGIDQVRLKVKVAGHDHTSGTFSMTGGETLTVPVIIGGYSDLEDYSALETTIEVTLSSGEKAEIVRTGQIQVGDGMLVLRILNEEFTRGVSGKVRFTLENTGEEEIEITTARNSGASGSNEITWYLMDGDDNVLSSLSFKQVGGEKIVALSNHNSVARIGAGETFTSDLTEIPVPASAPDDVTLQLAISHIYYHQGKEDQVRMNGLSSSHDITLMETSYYGEITNINPESSNGDEDIVITGRAVDRATENPMPGVPFRLVITTGGFDRSYDIHTDEEGVFSHTFTPLKGESGVYTVRAVHPDLRDRPVHGQFVIIRVSVSPANVNLSIPYNYQQGVKIRVNKGGGTEVNNLRLVYDETDQPEGTFPIGVHVSLPSSLPYLGAGKSHTFPLSIWADNRAEETGSLVLKVKSDETGVASWGTVLINTHFSEAQPVLYFTPNHVETGVAHDDSVTETITLKNNGLGNVANVSLSLINSNETPAPSWVYLNSAPNPGDIPVGEGRKKGTV